MHETRTPSEMFFLLGMVGRYVVVNSNPEPRTQNPFYKPEHRTQNPFYKPEPLLQARTQNPEARIQNHQNNLQEPPLLASACQLLASACRGQKWGFLKIILHVFCTHFVLCREFIFGYTNYLPDKENISYNI